MNVSHQYIFKCLLFLSPFLQNLESEAAAVFKEVAFDLTDVEFAVTASPEVFKEYEVTANKVVLFKKVRLKPSSGLQSTERQCNAGPNE